MLYAKSCAAKRYDASNMETLDVKWRELEFIQSFANLRAQMCAADCGNPRRLDSGLPRIE
jgi:hypothetical protein